MTTTESKEYEFDYIGDHSITNARNILCCGETGRVIAVFYEEHDLVKIEELVDRPIATKETLKLTDQSHTDATVLIKELEEALRVAEGENKTLLNRLGTESDQLTAARSQRDDCKEQLESSISREAVMSIAEKLSDIANNPDDYVLGISLNTVVSELESLTQAADNKDSEL